MDRKYIFREAEKRGLSIPELHRKLLQVIERDRLIGAILDDNMDDPIPKKKEPKK